MTLPALISEARAVREYLIQSPCNPDSESFTRRMLDRSAAIKRADRIIDDWERLAASPYASYVNAALRTECGVAQPIVSVMDTVDPEAR